MIIYDLSCDAEHRFEGWFASPQAFDQQLSRGLVDCPVCGSKKVRRVVSAVHLGSERKTEVEVAAPSTRCGSAAMSTKEAFAVYSRAVELLLQESEDVGTSFVEEARRIHYDEAPARRIHGQASDENFEELKDEGIDVMKLVVFKSRDDLN